MKNNPYKILSVAIFTILLSGCGDKLNIQPAQSVDATAALQTSKDVKATLIGAYSRLGSDNLYGGGFSVYADLLASAGDINFFGTFQGLTQIANKSIPVNNGFVAGTWLDGYSAINTANIVLNSLTLVDTVDRKRIEGEAKFIRGTIYFELVKLFAKPWNDGDPNSNLGVPIVLAPTNLLTEAEKQPARNTVAQVYAQVISDLTDAQNLLGSPSSVTYYYATTGAASAMLSRVYLTKGDYANALASSSTVINSGAYKLTNAYADEFPYTGRAVRIFNTSEDIFAQQVSEQSFYSDANTSYGENQQNTFYASSDKGGRGDIEMSLDFYNTYEVGDDRLGLFTDDGSGSYFYSDKFDNQFGNIKVLRLSEMYLTRAEANLVLGTNVGDTPLNDVNAVRARVKLPALSSVSISQVLNERHYELAFEGQWLTDYKRTNTAIASLPSNSPTLIFPIPQREIQVNPNLAQNDGY